MASDAQETLYRLFAGLAGAVEGGASAGGGMAGSAVASSGGIAGNAIGSGKGVVGSALGPGGGIGSGAIESILAAVAGAAIGTGSLSLPATAAETGAGSVAARVALNAVKSGMGVVPLVTALFGLFGGDDEEKPAPLVKYAMPARREFQAAAIGSGFAEVDYDQAGLPRTHQRFGAPGGSSAAERGAAQALPPITVNVQAMDARSFLDRSNEIAAAVREAMLNLNSINDVVTDL
jgi:hypothetical protein